jgi:hypothetical protein
MNSIRKLIQKTKRYWPTSASVTLLFLLLWGLSWWLNRSITAFSGDTGLRFLQVRELIANQWQTLAINYPGRIFDPDLLFVPYYNAYVVVDNEIFLSITPFMPWLASWGYAAGSVPGMVLVPVLGGVLTAVAVYRLVRLSRLPYTDSVLWLTIFATPMFFYSIEFWDHSLVAAAAVWSTYFLARGLLHREKKWLLLAGIIVGIGLGQRPEMYMFALALGIGALLVSGRQWPSLLLVVLGGLITAVPIWLWQYSHVGHPLGIPMAINLSDYGRAAHRIVLHADRPWYSTISRMLFYIEARDALTFVASLSISVGAIFFLLLVRVKRWQRPALWRAVAAIFLIGYLLVIVKVLDSKTAMIGVLVTLPLSIITLLFVERSLSPQPARLVYELVFAVAFLFFGGMLLIWPAFGGLQWGARYLLPFYPLAVYLAFYNYHHLVTAWPDWRGVELRRVMAAVVVVSLLLQVAGFYMQSNRHQESGKYRDKFAGVSTEVVVTNSLFLPAEAAALDEVIFLSVLSGEDLDLLIPRFWEQSVTEFAVVSFDEPLLVPEQVGELSVREIRPFVYELSEP